MPLHRVVAVGRLVDSALAGGGTDVDKLPSLAEYAALRGVTITLEDFDGFLQPFARTYPLLWFMEHVPGLRYTLDIGNFAFSDEDVSYPVLYVDNYRCLYQGTAVMGSQRITRN